ncbi:MAG: RIP metalloprotease RseP [Oligoflexia bacterium]|nr:RIP metalloprotease RseP [Oligoflexia bacterium]
MELIQSFLHQGFSFIVPLIVLLGVLIFVHELGHFSVAKYFGVRVEVFSLGFGKKILQKKIGDTLYCVSAIPFGGYVKMYGDDPTSPVPIENQKYSFNHKPVLPRIAIVLAGPLMNAFFAVILFAAIALIGEEAIQSKLGDISPSSVAYNAGFRSNDEILKINNQSVDRWDLVKKTIEENANKTLNFEILRDGKPVNVSAVPELTKNKNVLSSEEFVGDIEGLTYLHIAPAVGITSSKSIAAQSGLVTGDIIKKIDGKDIETFAQIKEQLKPGSTLTVTRKGQNKDVVLKFGDFKNFEILGIETSELYLANIAPKSGAELAGIKTGDKIVSINSQKIQRWEDVVKYVQSYKNGHQPLDVDVLREGQKLSYNVTPQLTKQPDAGGIERENYALGVVTGLVLSTSNTFIYKETNLLKSLAKGFSDTVKWTQLTVLSFVKLIQRKVSAKSIGGPLMIGKLASDTWKIGISPFFKIMAIISINLFVLNLLPVPVLDGGHLLFYTIELIKGRALSAKWLEAFQQVGMALLLALMLFSMYNDIVRFFT